MDGWTLVVGVVGFVGWFSWWLERGSVSLLTRALAFEREQVRAAKLALHQEAIRAAAGEPSSCVLLDIAKWAREDA